MLAPAAPLRPAVPADAIVDRIRRGGAALIALSGGVDSGLVASLAYEALGDGALAVTLTGAAVGADEIERAREVARTIGIAHRTVGVDPLARSEYRANPSNRCYFCRSVETEALRSFGAPRGIRQYLDGVHVDDLGDGRPGLKAMDEAGFRHPLLDAGLGKREVRALARARGLPNWDRPSDACLASRVAHGEVLSAALLDRIDRSERAVRALGFRRVRVRVSAAGARIEVDPDEVDRLRDEPCRSQAIDRVRAFGFEPVAIDPAGYRGPDARGPGAR